MKKWPLDMTNILQTREPYQTSNRSIFSFEGKISEEQRGILRNFLFDLEDEEEFLVYLNELEREFVAEIVTVQMEEDEYLAKGENSYELSFSIMARKVS